MSKISYNPTLNKLIVPRHRLILVALFAMVFVTDSYTIQKEVQNRF